MSQLGHHSFNQIFDNFRISGAIFLRFCVNVKTFWIISRYSYCIAGFILEKIGANNTSSPRTTPNRNLLGCRGFSSIASGFSSFISCSFVCWWKCVSSLKRMKKILRCFFLCVVAVLMTNWRFGMFSGERPLRSVLHLVLYQSPQIFVTVPATLGFIINTRC